MSRRGGSGFRWTVPCLQRGWVGVGTMSPGGVGQVQMDGTMSPGGVGQGSDGWYHVSRRGGSGFRWTVPCLQWGWVGFQVDCTMSPGSDGLYHVSRMGGSGSGGLYYVSRMGGSGSGGLYYVSRRGGSGIQMDWRLYSWEGYIPS